MRRYRRVGRVRRGRRARLHCERGVGLGAAAAGGRVRRRPRGALRADERRRVPGRVPRGGHARPARLRARPRARLVRLRRRRRPPARHRRLLRLAAVLRLPRPAAHAGIRMSTLRSCKHFVLLLHDALSRACFNTQNTYALREAIVHILEIEHPLFLFELLVSLPLLIFLSNSYS